MKSFLKSSIRQGAQTRATTTILKNMDSRQAQSQKSTIDVLESIQSTLQNQQLVAPPAIGPQDLQMMIDSVVKQLRTPPQPPRPNYYVRVKDIEPTDPSSRAVFVASPDNMDEDAAGDGAPKPPGLTVLRESEKPVYEGQGRCGHYNNCIDRARRFPQLKTPVVLHTTLHLYYIL